MSCPKMKKTLNMHEASTKSAFFYFHFNLFLFNKVLQNCFVQLYNTPLLWLGLKAPTTHVSVINRPVGINVALNYFAAIPVRGNSRYGRGGGC